MDEFNTEHELLQPANDDHELWARDYDRTKAEVDHFITDDMWRRGGLI